MNFLQGRVVLDLFSVLEMESHWLGVRAIELCLNRMQLTPGIDDEFSSRR